MPTTTYRRFNFKRTFGCEFEMVLSQRKIRAFGAALTSDIDRAEYERVRQNEGELGFAKWFMIRYAGTPCTAEGYGHDGALRTWKVKFDGSLRANNPGDRPIEVVSAVLKGGRGLAQVRRVLKALCQIAYVNTSCGFHVHHDVRDFESRPSAFKSIWKLYRIAQPTIDQIVAPSRRHNNFCQPVTAHEDTIGRTDAAFETRAKSWGDRYYAVNFASYRIRGTIEFRQHQGTVNWTKAIAWIVLTQSIVERAAYGAVRDANEGVEPLLAFVNVTGYRDGRRPDSLLRLVARTIRKQARALGFDDELVESVTGRPSRSAQ